MLDRSRPAFCAAASAATAAKGNLNIAEGGFGAQQVLQGALLGTERVLPVLALEFVGRRTHFGRGGFQVLHEILEFLIGSGQLRGCASAAPATSPVPSAWSALRQGSARSRRLYPWRYREARSRWRR